MPQIKAIIFDLDNTLVDFMRVKKQSIDEAMSAMIGAGLDMDKKEALKILYRLYDKYGIEYNLIFQEFLKKTIGKIDYKILASAIVAYRRIKFGFLDTYPAAQRTLLHLKMKGYKLAILSDAPRLQAWTRLAALKLSDFFDVVVTFEDTKKHKPHKKPFLTVMKKLKAAPEECLMVGDWPERDMKGAKSVGMKTCFASYGFHQKRKTSVETDYMIKDIKDLVKILK